ncbi:MAG: serine hydrolase, partial [Candidatus Nealsonbacteria bacterium]
QNLKYLLITLGLVFSVGWGSNALKLTLDDLFYWQQFVSNKDILTAQANQLSFEQHVRDLKPLRDNAVPDLAIKSKSAVSVLTGHNSSDRPLFEKEAREKLAIASLTKLMTAYVVTKHYDLEKEITVSSKAINQEENFGKLKAGQTLTVRELLYPLLIESSNDAAFALANDYNGTNEAWFIDLMNKEARNLGLNDTYFFNSSGLDPKDYEPQNRVNYSTALDLVKLAKEIIKNDLIVSIISTPKITLYEEELINTNQLLTEVPYMLGGKTGYTDKAQGCFLMISKAPKNKGYLINVILASQNRFTEMEKLMRWTQEAYLW